MTSVLNRATLVPFVFVTLGTMGACSSVDLGEPGLTTVEVIASDSNNGAGYAESLNYLIECLGLDFDNQNLAKDSRIDGAFELTDDATYAGAYLWRTSVVLPPGDCAIQVQAFGSGNEAICTMTEPFVVSSEAATEIGFVLVCSHAVQVPD